MPARNKLLIALSFILLALVLTSLLSPFFVAKAVALWLRYQGRRSGVMVTTAEIRAPFLHPVEIRGLRIVRAGRDGAHFQLDAARVEAALRLTALLDRSPRARPLRSLRIEHARVSLRGRALENSSAIDWETLGALVPEQFDISADELRFEQPLGRLELHDAYLSGNSNRSGALTVASLQLRGPYLQKSFADVHGVTRWQDARLTIGSLHLLEGLDIDSIALDLTRMRATRIAAETAVTVFNGNVRANFATERSGKIRLWEAAASASDISLSQLASALGLTEPLRGSLRASKFTFRGDPRDLLHATASVWTELTGFSWRERNADVIMIGANIYERAVQLQELYIKQRDNELTLSGETALSADWLNPDFRGDIDGSINDVGQFAELFGASSDAFAGKIAVRGRVHAHERRVDGDLALTGDALQLFRNPVDSLTARLTLDSPRIRLDQFEIRRGEDFLRGSGQIDFSHQKKFQLSADSWVHQLSEYHRQLPLLGALSGNLFTQLDASGDENAAAFSFAGETAESKFSASGTSREHTVAINSLTLSINEALAAFTGTINFGNPKKLSVTLMPADELRLAQNLQDVTCLRGIELHPGTEGAPFSQLVVQEHQLVLTGATPSPLTLPLCSQGAAQPLLINVPAPTSFPPPVMPLPSPMP